MTFNALMVFVNLKGNKNSFLNGYNISKPWRNEET
jgi:hypothetical protein